MRGRHVVMRWLRILVSLGIDFISTDYLAAEMCKLFFHKYHLSLLIYDKVYLNNIVKL